MLLFCCACIWAWWENDLTTLAFFPQVLLVNSLPQVQTQTRLLYFLKTKTSERIIKSNMHFYQTQTRWWALPGITSQTGTRRVCSRLAKLHSSFPSKMPSQSPIGLSWRSGRREPVSGAAEGLHVSEPALSGSRVLLLRPSSPSLPQSSVT